MVEESPRCAYFSLSKRAQKKIFNYMDLAQTYRLGTVSKKWQTHVQDKNIQLSSLKFNFLNESFWIEVCSPAGLIVQISNQTAEEKGPLNHEGLLCVEFPRNPNSNWSRFNQMLTVFQDLNHMYTIPSINIHLGPIPDFLDVFDSLIPVFNYECDTLEIGDPEAYADKITRAQLKHVLNKGTGRQLITYNIESGPAIFWHVRFDIVESNGSNWISNSMLWDTLARKVRIMSPDGTGQAILPAYVSDMIFQWYLGNMRDLEYVLCHFWIPTLDNVPDDFLGYILNRIRPLDAPPLGAPPVALANRTRYFQRVDGKPAAICYSRQEFIIEFTFISW